MLYRQHVTGPGGTERRTIRHRLRLLELLTEPKIFDKIIVTAEVHIFSPSINLSQAAQSVIQKGRCSRANLKRNHEL